MLDLCTPALSAKLRLHIPGKPIDIVSLILNLDPNPDLSQSFFKNMERMQARYHKVGSWLKTARERACPRLASFR